MYLKPKQETRLIVAVPFTSNLKSWFVTCCNLLEGIACVTVHRCHDSKPYKVNIMFLCYENGNLDAWK